MNNEKYKDQIAYYKARVMLVIGLVAALVIGEGLMVWQWYGKEKKKIGAVKTGFSLERGEFDKLWKSLTEKTIEVELRQEIRYGGDVGKLEPFE